jgi:DNA polymerase I
LQKLSEEHEICQRILTFRGLCKLRSTYVEGLLAQINTTTGKIHTSYNQTVAATGRLSSSNPNLQNIPVGGEAAYDVRSVFVPEKGWQFLSADYSQVELRLLADMSGDPELKRAFENDEDIHSFTAQLIFGGEKVTSDQRRIAKTINFGVVYGQTPFGLSQTLKISPAQAKDFIDRYFARYGQVKAYLNGLIVSARESGFAVTRLGRRRRVADINSQNRMQREMSERVAINMPIQGTAADMIKIAMVSLYRRLKKEKLAARMVLQVHDELVFEAPPEEKDLLEKIVREEMEAAMKLSVPLKVDLCWGTDWSQCG